MKHLFHTVFAAAAILSCTGQSAGQSIADSAVLPVAPSTVLWVDSAAPAASVVRHFGWLESGLAANRVSVRWADDGKLDFASADGAVALKARA